jgi:GT2 family glycosyltransferase
MYKIIEIKILDKVEGKNNYYYSFSSKYFNYAESGINVLLINCKNNCKEIRIWKGLGKHKLSKGNCHFRLNPSNKNDLFNIGNIIKIKFFDTNKNLLQKNLLNFLIDNNINNLHLSNDLKKFYRIYNIYILKPYENNCNCIFFGVYNNDDLSKIKNHNGKKIIMLGGSDIKNIDKLKTIIKKDDQIISISKWLNIHLNNLKIDNTFIELDLVNYKIFNPVVIKGESIYVYDGDGKTIKSESKKEIYNSNLIDKIIKKFPQINFIRSSSLYSFDSDFNNYYDSIPNVYKKCFIGLRLTNYDGNANTVQEFKAMNIPIVHNHSEYGLKWGKIDDIVNYINYYRYEYKNNKILVVLPTFNRSNKIENIIEMMKNQTFKNFKLLIIDDGSSMLHLSNFNNIKHKYKQDNKIIFFKNDKNMNIANTLNKGLKYFNDNHEFTFFTWISDDNIYFTTFLEKLIINNNYFSYSSYNFVNKLKNTVININKKYNVNDLINNFEGCASFMWTRKAIEDIGIYNTTINGCEDWEYLLRTFNSYNFKLNYEKTPLMDYIRHDNSLYFKNSKKIQTLKSNILIIYKYLDNNKDTFIYYSKTKYNILDKTHKIIRYFNNNFNKIVISNEKNIFCDKNSNVLVVPFDLKDGVFNFVKKTNTYLYFNDSNLYNEIKIYKIEKIFDFKNCPYSTHSYVKNSINISNYILYDNPDNINHLNKINNKKQYHYIDNNLSNNHICEEICKIFKKDLSIVLLCFNHLEYTKQCIESILKNTTNKNYELIIVNNGSTDGTNKYLNDIENRNTNVKVIHNIFNLGFSKGMNMGVKYSIGKYLILLNNDTIVNTNWDTPLIDILKNNKDIFAVTPLTNSCGNESMINIKHENPIDFFSKATNICEKLVSKFNCNSLALFCGCFRNNDFVNIGCLDEKYLNGWEDDDLYEKIKNQNKKVYVSTKSLVYHFGSITVGKNNYKNSLNKLIFENKWKKKWIKPSNKYYVNHKIIENKYKKLNHTKQYISNNNSNIQKLLFKKIPTNKNCIEIDPYLYNYLNNERIINTNDILNDIYFNGVEKGYIYASKQIINHFNVKDFYNYNNIIYTKINNNYINLKLLVDSLYEKNFNYYINDIEILNDSLNTVTEDIVCCFIGDCVIGKKLINKLLVSKKIRLSTIFIFNDLDIYLKLKDDIELFTSRIIFKSNEYGSDIIPTLQAINYMKRYNIRWVYKFHTKSDKKWFNNCTDYLINLEDINLNEHSNCIGAKDYFLSIYDKKYINNKYIIKKYENHYHKKYFVRGSIFLTHIKTFLKVIEFIKNNNYISYFINNMYDTNAVNFSNSHIHFLEVLFGIIQVNINYQNRINYNIIKENMKIDFINNKLWAHLHCFNIDQFNEIYGEYINNIIKYFSILVTFSKGKNIPVNNITVIKIENKGMDIGGKICCVDYLYRTGINFKNILFLHSKNNLITRRKYFNPFVKNIKQINYICSIINHYDIISSELISDGDWNKKNGFTINKYYIDEYNKLMGFNNITSLFIEGNCLIVSNKLLTSIFPKNKLNYFYSQLNTETSFDYNWVKFQYKLFNKNFMEVYNAFKNSKLKGNSLSYNNEKLNNNYDKILSKEKLNINNYFLKDGSYEHLWERLWINVCKNINGKMKIIKYENIFDTNFELEYNFDLNLYRLLNTDNKLNNSISNIYKIKKSITNEIYSLKQILQKLPLDFDIKSYVKENNLKVKNKYEAVNHFIKNNNKCSKLWIDAQSKKLNEVKVFLIVFPQFHEIPENNKFWGDGFTEWWNVRKIKQINNQHLPMNPHHDIGYYNILDYDTRKRWNDYAENFGFFGYIFYHYIFSKGLVMNKPLDKILEDGQPDKPWFLSWVNENWTKRWDGGDNEIMLEVKYNEEICYKHFNNLLKYFKHPNYYKVNNKPFLALYKAGDIPKFYLNIFNALALKNGFNGITYISTLNNKALTLNSKYDTNYCDYDFEFPPNYSGTLPGTFPMNNNLISFDKKLSKEQIKHCHNYDIDNHLKALTLTSGKKNKLIRGLVPCWDNYPRHSTLDSNCYTQLNSNSFMFYLVLVKQFILIKKEKGEYHIINSLNEWAEQCVMEPSIQNEYSYLEALKLAIHTNLDIIDERLLDNLIHF